MCPASKNRDVLMDRDALNNNDDISEVTDTGSETNDEIFHVNHEHSVCNDLKPDSPRLLSGFRSGSVDTNANVVDASDDGDSSIVIFCFEIVFFGKNAKFLLFAKSQKNSNSLRAFREYSSSRNFLLFVVWVRVWIELYSTSSEKIVTVYFRFSRPSTF